MHVTLPISTETTLMGADNTEAYKEAITHSGFSLINYTDGKDEADRLFNGLSGNGRVGLPMTLHFGVLTMVSALTNLGFVGRLLWTRI